MTDFGQLALGGQIPVMTQLVSDEAVYNYIKKMSGATIQDVSANFDISESTVRRTMVRLDEMGWLRRFRGGAVALPVQNRVTAYEKRLRSNNAKKEAIARKAAENIKDGSSVILLGGTTVSSMCAYLQGRQLNVITNSLAVIDQLKGAPGIKLIVLGGAYNHEEYEFVGNMTSQGLRFMYADGLYLSCVGFSPEVGFMTNHIDIVEFYRLCMKNADKTFVLADSSKLKRKGIAVFGEAKEVDFLISDKELSEEAVDLFNAKQVRVELVTNK